MTSPFGSYDLLDRIAVGGMAEVYIARSREPRFAGRALVVKRMLSALASRPESVTMFLDEAKLGTLLRHPHIVEVLDVGQVEGAWFMALELVDGQDLGFVLKTARDRRELLPAPFAAYIVARAAEGLHFAHEVRDPKSGEPLELVHRDVGPQNILVARNGDVKVADFGVAQSEQQLHHTRTGLVKGKIAYMSPEQVGGQRVDRRTDVFALGVTLWEAITHRRLYPGLGEVEIMKKVYLEQPPAPSSVKPDVDNALENIVMRAMNRSRSARFQTAGELAAALDAWCAAQRPAPAAPALSEWMRARFSAREVDAPVRVGHVSARAAPAGFDDVATDETRLSPAREAPDAGGATRGDDEVDATDTMESAATVFGAEVPELVEVKPAVQQPPRTPLPRGLKLKLVSGAPTKPRKKRDVVLYVEDEDANWQVAELRLQDTYELLHASDDQAACEIVRARGQELAAVLMDIQLKGSELDGIALVRLLRGGLVGDKLPPYARGIKPLQIPVFFVTAYAARYAEQDLLALGADKLVTKPVDFHELTLALTSSQLRRVSLPT